METKVIDFTDGMWGHTLHASTWMPAEPPKRGWWQRRKDRKANTRWFSVLVHSMVCPQKGQMIRYNAEGGPAMARIYAVKPFYNLEDMFKLFLLRDREIDLKHNVLL